MREGLLEILRCVSCKNTGLRAEVLNRDENEIRKAKILCDSCGAVYSVNDGIADFLINRPPEIENEQRAVEQEEYLRDDKGNSYPVNRDSIERFKAQFLLLPEGDGSIYFRRGGCFQSIAEGSHRFYDTMTRMALKGGEMILCLGDGFSYGSYKFAQRGCNAVALDISNYLMASDIYVRKAYFERVFSDMHEMPFRDNAFDIVFCSAALHHSKRLKAAFQEIGRVLKQGGKLFVINESSRGSLEKVNPSFKDLEERGYSDTSYTLSEWVRAAVGSGFRQARLEMLSLADDYIVRQENKNAGLSNFLRIAYFLRDHRGIEKFLLSLLKYPRILSRPKSWRMVCSK